MQDSNIPAAERIGILGGTFDPIHLGHLLLAEQAREQLGLDQVRFVPANVSPLKTESIPRASSKQRVEMVELATCGNPYFEVDSREIARGGTSFTIDTLREIRQENPHAALYFILGADSLESFSQWRQPREICEVAKVIVLARGGFDAPNLELLRPYLPPDQQPDLVDHLLSIPQVEISSSDLRRRIHAGRSTRYQLPAAVAAYIQEAGLYCSSGPTDTDS